MGRPRGSHNPGYATARHDLVRKLTRALQAPGGARASFRELALAADVSVPTLKHYFHDRAGVITAVLEAAHAGGQRYLDEVATSALSSLRASLDWFLRYVLEGLMEHDLAALHELGLAAGFRDDALGPAYLEHVLEPTLQSLEARLARHLAAGDLVPCDLRVAGLQLVAPLLVAVLHQVALGGVKCRPLRLEAFVDAHLEAWLRAYEVPRLDAPTRAPIVTPTAAPRTRRARRPVPRARQRRR